MATYMSVTNSTPEYRTDPKKNINISGTLLSLLLESDTKLSK
jgi:hypothetical protein